MREQRELYGGGGPIRGMSGIPVCAHGEKVFQAVQLSQVGGDRKLEGCFRGRQRV